MEAIWQVAPQADMLVIDDNSPTARAAGAMRRRPSEPRLKCLHRAGKLGLGTATIAGMQYAIEHGYDYVLNMDADFSHHPRYIPAYSGWRWKSRPMSRSARVIAPAAARRLALQAAVHELGRQHVCPLLAGPEAERHERRVSAATASRC